METRSDGLPGHRTTAWERILYITLAGLTLAYLVIRAIKVPFVQDEANSVWLYLQPGEWLPFRSHPDAGNHFLNTLLGLIGFEIAGYSPIAIRWGSLAAFPFYAWACWMLVRAFPRLLRWCALLALLWCPFLLDFFALFRGYGLSMAAWAWALYAFTQIKPHGAARQGWILATALFVALFSNLSLLPAALAIWAGVVLLALDRREQSRPGLHKVLPLLVIIPAILAVAIIISLDLQRRDLLYLGTQNGTLDTARTLYQAIWIRTPSDALLLLIVLPAWLALFLAVARWVRTRDMHDPIVLLTGVLFADVAARWVMHALMGTNFPVQRAALHWVPLYILVVAHACHALGRRWPVAYAASLGLLVFPVKTIRDLNTDRLITQYELALPQEFVRQAHTVQDSLGRPALIAGRFQNEWAFQQATMGLEPIEMRADIAPGDPDDMRVLAGSTLDKYGAGFHIVDRNSTGTVLLLLRDEPIQWKSFADTVLTPYQGADEFIPLPIPMDNVGSGMLMEFRAHITAADRDASLQLITTLKAQPDSLLRYDDVRFEHWTGLLSGIDVDVARYLPATQQGQWVQAYIWNVRRSVFKMEDVQLRFFSRPADSP